MSISHIISIAVEGVFYWKVKVIQYWASTVIYDKVRLRTVISYKNRPDLPPPIASTVITHDRESKNIDGEGLDLAFDAVL